MACTRHFLLVSLFYSVVRAFYVLAESGIKIDVVQVPEQCDILAKVHDIVSIHYTFHLEDPSGSGLK